MCRSLAIFGTVWQLEAMNMHQENPALYFATLNDFVKSVQREIEKAEQEQSGSRLQMLHLSEARFKLTSLIRTIDRVIPPPESSSFQP